MPEKNRRRTTRGESRRDEAKLLLEAQEELNLAWQSVMLDAEEFGVPKSAPAPARRKTAAAAKPTAKKTAEKKPAAKPAAKSASKKPAAKKTAAKKDAE